MPFNSARATCPRGPTGLADGLELESTPTRDGESAPRHSRWHKASQLQWFPRFRTSGTELGYTSITISKFDEGFQGRAQTLTQTAITLRSYSAAALHYKRGASCLESRFEAPVNGCRQYLASMIEYNSKT